MGADNGRCVAPRLAQTMPVPVSAEQLDQFTDPDPTRRAVARAGVPVVAEVHRFWRAQVSWRPAEGSTGVRVLRVLDTAAGVWAVELHGSRVMLFPSTPAAIWRALTGPLPTDLELGVDSPAR